jgi:hypothetical protein
MNNDLISRSALLGGYDVRKVTEYDESGCGLEYKAVSVEAIEAAPAVDAEPVRHERWEHGVRCTQCGQIDLSKPSYCCCCGAKMDAEVKMEVE